MAQAAHCSILSIGDKARDTRIDAMRVFAILFIVMHHLVDNVIPYNQMASGVDFAILPQYLVVAFWDCFLVIGVNLFFAASGYFSTSLKPAKMLQLLCKVYIFWLVGMLLAWAVQPSLYSTAAAFFKALVVAIARYWFVIVYMLLMLVAPLLNRLAQYIAAEGRRIRYFVFLSTLFFCVIGFVSDNIYPYMGTDGGYTVIWAAIPYLYGRLIRLKQDRLRQSVGFWTILYAVFSILNFGLIATLICTDNGSWALHCSSYNNPLVLASSLCFVMMFVSARPTEGHRVWNYLLSLVSVHTLGVYLVHTNNPFLHSRRTFLMDLVAPLWAKFVLLPLNAILLVAIGVAVDALYQWLLGKPIGRLCAGLERGILRVYEGLMRGLQRLFARRDEGDLPCDAATPPAAVRSRPVTPAVPSATEQPAEHNATEASADDK